MNDHPPPCPQCGDDFAIQGYLSGRLPESETGAFEEHLLTCDACQEGLRLAVAIREGLADAMPRRASEGLRFKVFMGTALAAAATIAIVLLLPTTGDIHRSDEAPVDLAPALASPIGEVTVVAEFTWMRSSAADRYRPVLLDAEGSIVWEAEATADTFAWLPAELVLEPGESYYWKVDGRVGFDRWISSELASFTLKPAAAGDTR